MELVPGGDLLELVNAARGLPESEARYLFQQLVRKPPPVQRAGRAERLEPQRWRARPQRLQCHLALPAVRQAWFAQVSFPAVHRRCPPAPCGADPGGGLLPPCGGDEPGHQARGARRDDGSQAAPDEDMSSSLHQQSSNAWGRSMHGHHAGSRCAVPDPACPAEHAAAAGRGQAPDGQALRLWVRARAACLRGVPARLPCPTCSLRRLQCAAAAACMVGMLCAWQPAQSAQPRHERHAPRPLVSRPSHPAPQVCQVSGGQCPYHAGGDDALRGPRGAGQLPAQRLRRHEGGAGRRPQHRCELWSGRELHNGRRPPMVCILLAKVASTPALASSSSRGLCLPGCSPCRKPRLRCALAPLQADVWSCGVLLYVTLFCAFPFAVEPAGGGQAAEAQQMHEVGCQAAVRYLQYSIAGRHVTFYVECILCAPACRLSGCVAALLPPSCLPASAHRCCDAWHAASSPSPAIGVCRPSAKTLYGTCWIQITPRWEGRE